MKQISSRGLDIIKQFEGLRLEAYKCPAGIWTVGYGHTGKDVYEGLHITQLDADMLLIKDVVMAEQAVSRLVNAPINQNQFSALTSFTYNLGSASLQNSTLLSKVNAHEYEAAAEQFLRWNKAKGVVLPGLTKRRQAERELFLSPMPGASAEVIG